ncbi:sodium-dependent lysophosphatidylcholine symporter 1 [Electrophorus electricus]|uniref:sodium-dependent lysophosphatidylcholine symporter 1 n=1 Tax=Electrophorus electricus TaxID=8005 RepID=UPI0015CFB6D9|nr:sodium-dependent lysophosphatidylcholine symporter 1 [Electrophorus electricus]
MTLSEVLQDKPQLLKEAFSRCTTAEQDEGSKKDGFCRHGGIPLSTKLCYAVGGVPYQAASAAMAFSFQIFLLDVVQMEAFFVSLILFISRVWDAITDPLVGYLVSKSKWTPVGKLQPWSVLSMPLVVLSYILLWFVPRTAQSSSVSVPWYLTISCLFQTFLSCYHVPYTALNMFLGGSERDRDSATACRMSAEVLAMLFAAVAQGQVLRVYNVEREHSCPGLHRQAFMTSALVLGAGFFLCCMILFLGVKEQKAGTRPVGRGSYLTDLKMLITHVSYQRLVLGFLFSSLAFQMSLGNFALFCIHVAGLGSQLQYLILAILVAAAVSVPVWQMSLVRLGKKRTLFIGLPLIVPALIVLVSVSDNFPVYLIMCVLVGASVATLFLLPWSMLPDVVDEFAIQNPCHRDLEPLFFSCSCFCNKLGGGLSAGISTMTLHLTGYKIGACGHSEGVVLALHMLLALIPIVLLLVGLIFFYLYPIDETRRQQIQQELRQTRSRTEMVLSTEEDTGSQQRNQQQCPNKGVFLSKTSRMSSVKAKKSSNLNSLTSLQTYCDATTDPFSPKSSRPECTLKPEFYKHRISSKSSRPSSQLSRQPSWNYYETHAQRAKVTWV